MSQPNPNSEKLSPADAELLELYLDGQLEAERSAHFEKRIAAEPGLKAVVRQQTELDGLLGQWCQPPAVDSTFVARLGDGDSASHDQQPSEQPDKVVLRATKPRSPESWRQRGLAAVALLACALTWVFFGWEQLKSLVTPEQGYTQTTVAQLYQDAVQAGFEPDWLCKDDQEFAQTFHDRQGTGLLLNPLPQDVRMAGLAYREGFTEQATCMFAYADEQPVLVIAARSAEISERLLQVGDQGLSVFTRELGDLTLVEVSPLDRARILEFFYESEVPSEPTGHIPGAP